ncbi:MAG: tellurium resistance protein TerC [Ponticaulis sp.]|nr:tellurium resistance protein TerC [Ponticaulis sp.]|tara:strand:- start:31752 stop:32639 length:888 start_codon:yes stop_codon:yes gene_type:complete
MAEIFSVSGLFTLLMLILLQAVLGFDNLLYISIESKRVGEEGGKASMVRRWGIGLAVAFRIVLLIIIVNLFTLLAAPFLKFHIEGIFEIDMNLQALVTLVGGGFIIYTAVKEINHLLAVDHIEHTEGNKKKSVVQAIAMIVAMNLVFSFDSILSAMAIANTKTETGEIEYQVWIMAIAIILSGIAMILLADTVAEFLKKNRMYEVLGLFILFIVGALLVSEGGHLAHLVIFDYEIHAIEKSTFYLVIFVLVVTDIISTNYQKRLWSQREAELQSRGDQDAAAQAAEDAKSGVSSH